MFSRFWDDFGPGIQALLIAVIGWIVVFLLLDMTFAIASAWAWCIDIGGGTYCF